MKIAYDALSQVPPLFELERYVAVNPLMNETSKPFRAAVESWAQNFGLRPPHAQHYSQHRKVERPGFTIDQILGFFLSSYYDRGTAIVPAPWKNRPLLEAWKDSLPASVPLPRKKVRPLVELAASLPSEPLEALRTLHERAGNQAADHKIYYEQLLTLLPGWAMYLRQLTWPKAVDESSDLAALLVMIFAAEIACGPFLQKKEESVEWSDAWWKEVESREESLRQSLEKQIRTEGRSERSKIRVKAAFCIDVRSERIRRHWEQLSSWVQTDGCAGFFSAALSWKNASESHAESLAPVLVSPHLHLESSAQKKFGWKSIEKSIKSALGGPQGLPIVESLGLIYGFQFLIPLHRGRRSDRYAGLEASARKIPLEQKVETVRQLLFSLGWTSDWPQVGLFVGHESASVNNPHSASLDCGACGGRSGEANARVCAMWANEDEVRKELVSYGFDIPKDCRFYGAVHNTSVDRMQIFWDKLVDPSLKKEIENSLDSACRKTRQERRTSLRRFRGLETVNPTSQAETRPDMALLGNRAFVVAPRSWTSHIDLQGTVFLHSYENDLDPEGRVLESILTAPVVVAHWINAQYWFSSVFPERLSAGDKTIHSVVGGFGIFEGTHLDVKSGLPLQSLYCDDTRLHDPIRLQVFVAAPRNKIDRILSAHAHVRELFENQWMDLICVEDKKIWKREQSNWIERPA